MMVIWKIQTLSREGRLVVDFPAYYLCKSNPRRRIVVKKAGMIHAKQWVTRGTLEGYSLMDYCIQTTALDTCSM